MPVKTDGTGKRWIEMEFVAPGTPEQLWQAMATGAGNTAWFTRATIDERVGGAIRFEFGPDTSTTGEVTTWEPPRRFGYVERDWSEGAPPVATEITITSRAGGKCVVRMVHSLFASSDDWDDQLESFESGWPSFFDVLRLYLAHFAGEKAASFHALVNVDGDDLTVWRRLTAALGLAGADAGEQRTTPQQPETLRGVVERIQQDRKMRFAIMRLESPAPGVALIGTYAAANTINASVGMFLYGDDREQAAAASEAAWRTWLNETFAAAG
jgi:uncharacterized protein YndB with AHSA1/START domain